MIISFSWTTEALLQGHKSVTRREWAEKHARQFKIDKPHKAYDSLPHQGGKMLGWLVLTQEPYQEQYADAPNADFEAEGLGWMQANYEQALRTGALAGRWTMDGHLAPLAFWNAQKLANPLVWVVRFKFQPLSPKYAPS